MADEPTKPGETPANTGETPNPTPNAEGKQDGTETAPSDGQNIEGLKAALAAERKRAKEMEKAARETAERLRELEDREKTEAEKLADRNAQLEKELKAVKVEGIRQAVVLEKKVPPALMELLTGDTREEIEQKADLILAQMKPVDATDFDHGAREPAPKAKSPEEEHAEFLGNLLRASR